MSDAKLISAADKPLGTVDTPIGAAHKTNTPAYDSIFLHIHNEYEIYFSCCDNNKFFIGNSIYNVDKYDIFLFDNIDLHKIDIGTKEVYDRYVVYFSPEIVKKAMPNPKLLLSAFDKRLQTHSHKLSLRPEKAPHFISLIEKMISLQKDAYAYEMRMLLILAEILLFINEEKANKQNNVNIFTIPNSQINEIASYIRENLSQDLTLDAIGKRFFIDKYYLCRQFKKETGLGIIKYIQFCRISQAILLLQKGLNVSEVAYKIGFNSDTYFISSFKSAVGMTPKRYALQVKHPTKT